MAASALGNPNDLHAIFASRLSHSSSHIPPHTPPWYISTFPCHDACHITCMVISVFTSVPSLPPVSLISPSLTRGSWSRVPSSSSSSSSSNTFVSAFINSSVRIIFVAIVCIVDGVFVVVDVVVVDVVVVVVEVVVVDIVVVVAVGTNICDC